MRKLPLALLLVSLTPFAPAQAPHADGAIVVESAHSVADTQARLEQAIEENDLILVNVIAHDENAAAADLELRPTRLVIFGNPAVGTQLMQATQSIALDLPQKMLIWEDEDGDVYLAYNDPAYLAERHDVSGLDELLGNISNALQNLAEAATAP